MQAPYDRERGQAPGGGDHGWHPDPPGQQGQPEQPDDYWEPYPAPGAPHHPYAQPHPPYDPYQHAGHQPADSFYDQEAQPPQQAAPPPYHHDPRYGQHQQHYQQPPQPPQDPQLYQQQAPGPYRPPQDPRHVSGQRYPHTQPYPADSGYPQEPHPPRNPHQQHYQLPPQPPQDPRQPYAQEPYPPQPAPGPYGEPQQWAQQPYDEGAYGGYDGSGPPPAAPDPQAAPGAEYGQQQEADDAFAYLFRDQHTGPRRYTPPEQPYPTPPPDYPAAPPRDQEPPPQPEEPAARTQPAPAAGRRPGKAASLLKSSAVMAAGTLVSRATGFIRQLVIVAALGAAVLGDTYTVAWALPNMIYMLTIGGGLNSVFVPQLVRAMKNDDDGGEAYANRLLTLVTAVLGALVIVAFFAAPLLVKMMSPAIAGDEQANDVAVTFARYCLPTIFFMGIHVVLGQVLNARDRFGPMMWTPVLNNIVVIFTFGMFLWVYGTQRSSGLTVGTITPEGVRLLGVGTLLGLTVQALAMVPYLRAAGFRLRPRFDWRGHGMGKAARLAKWTVLFVLANQIGLIIITQFATWAGQNAEESGHTGAGYIAYSSALLIWQMPQAIITVSVMAALLPRLSRSAADGDTAAVRDDLSQGLRTSAVAIVPLAFAFVALGVPMCTLLFGSAGEEGARSFGYILMAFGLGLIPYSAQYVVLRAFYAYEDTRTPFSNTVIVSGTWILLSALCFVTLPDRWIVAGIAFSYGIAYAIGVRVAWRRLRRRLRSDLDGARVVRTYVRLIGASIPAALVGGAVGYAVLGALGEGLVGSFAALASGGLLLLAVFYLAARRMRIEELTSLISMVRARLGR